MGTKQPRRIAAASPPPIATGDCATVLNSIRRIVRILRVAARRAETELGVSGAQLFVLQQLAQAPAQSLNDLAARTLTDQSSVSVVVSRLVDRGLVSRKPAPNDGRRLVIGVTPAGRALLRRAPDAAQSRILGALDRLPTKDCHNLAMLLEKLVAETGASDEPVTFLFEDDWKPARTRKTSGNGVSVSGK
jgi:MarR family transcriptional regulator, lower aerobic nicotinate degradation pathway regulator